VTLQREIKVNFLGALLGRRNRRRYTSSRHYFGNECGRIGFDAEVVGAPSDPKVATLLSKHGPVRVEADPELGMGLKVVAIAQDYDRMVDILPFDLKIVELEGAGFVCF
jgi:hypothetical protein